MEGGGKVEGQIENVYTRPYFVFTDIVKMVFLDILKFGSTGGKGGVLLIKPPK